MSVLLWVMSDISPEPASILPHLNFTAIKEMRDKKAIGVYDEPVRNEEALHVVREEKNILQTVTEGRLTGLVISCIGTDLQNT
jgi:hypothetical protein